MKLWRYGHAIEYLGQRYRLEGTLGSGGMADVCLAWDEHEACEVAIKVIKSDQLEQRTLDRFIKEAAQVARWRHPNILRIYSDLKLELLDAAQGSIVPYIVMEYAQGGDLHKRLTPGEPYPFAATLDLFAQLCSAVAYAHEHGVIHRDLKPLNILFRQLPGGCEQVVLSDFGLAVEANATHHTFAHAGTLLYMAPEQFRGCALPASDVFALGVILYQLCTGRLPFRRNLQELHRLNSAVPTPPSFIASQLPEELDDIILTALAPDPEQRYHTASALWEAIHAVVYNNHLKPAYSTLPQRSSGITSPRPSISRRTAPQRAIHPISQRVRQEQERSGSRQQRQALPGSYMEAQRMVTHPSFPEQLDIVADSQDLPPPVANPAVHTSHTHLKQPISQIDTPDADLPGYSYSRRISSIEQKADLERAGRRSERQGKSGRQAGQGKSAPGQSQSVSSVAYRSALYGAGEPLPSLQAPSSAHRSSGMRPPVTSPPTRTSLSRSPRPLTLFLAILGVGVLLASLIYFAPSRSVLNMLPAPAIMRGTTVTITPDSKQIANSYIIRAVANPDPNKREIAARTLSSQQTQRSNVNGTGHNKVAATTAKGMVTFTNGSSNVFTVAAGTRLQAANGAFIVTDVPATIPAANLGVSFGQTAVVAHAANVGADGNIPSGSINGTCCTNNGVITVRNNNAFTGGQDAKSYTFIQQSDVNAFVNAVKPQLMQQASSALTAQLKAGEQLGQATTNCPATVQHDNPIGDQGQNVPAVNVTVAVTCKASAYDQNGLRSLASHLLQLQASTDTSANYLLQGTITIHTQVQQTDQDNGLSLLVNASGLWTYRLSAAQKQQLAKLIAGKTVAEARRLLEGQAGVHNVSFAPGREVLPSDAGQIDVEV